MKRSKEIISKIKNFFKQLWEKILEIVIKIFRYFNVDKFADWVEEKLNNMRGHDVASVIIAKSEEVVSDEFWEKVQSQPKYKKEQYERVKEASFFSAVETTDGEFVQFEGAKAEELDPDILSYMNKNDGIVIVEV